MAKKNKSLRRYPSKYPCRIPSSLSDSEWRKQRTLELYSYLPQTTLEERAKYTDIRDEVIFLNYKFFGYVAAHVYIKNSSVTYDDKFQSALLNFCSMWHKYMYGQKYRTDLAFSVFFKPRLSECIYREMLTVKHTVNRSLKMEAADQLGIKFSELTYDDLSKVSMPPDKMAALKAVFYADCEEDVDNAALYVSAPSDQGAYDEDLYSDAYNDIEHVLMEEMVQRERLLTTADILDISDMLGIDVKQLQDALPAAEDALKTKLISVATYRKSFSDDF